MGQPDVKNVYIEAATLGNPATLVAADAVRFESFDVQPIGEQIVERHNKNSSTAPSEAALISKKHLEATWSTYFYEPQTPGTFSTSHLADLIQSCPVVTADADPGAGQCTVKPSMVYDVDTQPIPVSMLVVYTNLEQRQLDDCISIIETLSAEVGMPLMISGKSHATFAARAAVSLSDVTYTNKPDDVARFQGSAVTVTGATSGALTLGCVRNFELGTGMQLQLRECASATHGYTISLAIHGEQSRLTMVFERLAPGTTDWETFRESGESMAIVIPLSDGTEIQVATAKVGKVTPGVVNDVLVDTVEFLPYGTDWFVIETNN